MTILLDGNSSLMKGTARPVNAGDNVGQQGFTRNQAAWASNARYVKGRGIPFLISEPPLMRYLPDADFRTRLLRSLIEERATNITGINSTLTTEFNETSEGYGEMRESVLRSIYERSVPAFEWPELYNKVINPFWEDYTLMFMDHPEFGIPGVAMTEAYLNDPDPLPLIEANQSFVTLFVEPSHDMRKVVSAVLCANMMPKSGGENTITRVTADAPEAPVVSIEFTAMSDRSEAVFKMAQQRLDSLNAEMLDPAKLAARATFIEGVSANVDATKNGFYGAIG